MAKDYTNIGVVLSDMDNNQQAVESTQTGLNILLELEQQTGYHHPLIETLKDGSIYNDHQERVFISYARLDSVAAQRLYNDLSSKTDLKPWLDKKNLLPGQTWHLEIRKAIKNSRYFLALFSSTSVSKRGYVQSEFRKAIDILEEFPEGEIFAIPVRLDDCEIPYERFTEIERVDMFPDWDKGIMRLLKTFGAN